MKGKIKRLKSVAMLMLLLGSMSSMAQNIEVQSQFGEYVPADFPGYGNNPAAEGFFYASVVKASGTIPAGTAMIVVTLAPEVPWTMATFDIPAGWELVPSSDSENLAFVNTSDWVTTEPPIFVIPVRAIRDRSSTAFTVGTQIMNTGGDWTDPVPGNNATISAVTVANNPLPVKLVNFTAVKEGVVSQLVWATTEESNSDRFEVERSGNGKSWSNIGSVVSSGESVSLKNYNFTDKAPLTGENLYRLKMVDKDATFAYSSIRSVRFDEPTAYVYPNPSADKVFLNKANITGVSQVSVWDMNGRVVLTTKSFAQGIDVKTLAQGAYLLKVSHADGSSASHKFVISR
jgi:hypothetical protein